MNGGLCSFLCLWKIFFCFLSIFLCHLMLFEVLSTPKTHCAQVTTISWPPPPPKKRGPFWGGYVFLDFFNEFLRWGQKILHDNSRGLSGLSGRILADQMPFPATNLVLNFIFFAEISAILLIFKHFFFQSAKKWPNHNKVFKFCFFFKNVGSQRCNYIFFMFF